MASLDIKVDPAEPVLGAATTNGSPPKNHYYPGSLISGTLHLHSPNPVQISSVSITLRGRAKVKSRSSEHYTTRSFRSRALFFPPLSQTLFDSTNVVGANATSDDGHTKAFTRTNEGSVNILQAGAHFSHKAGEYVWPFKLRLPDHCDVNSIVTATNSYGTDSTSGAAAFATTKPKWHLDNMGMMQRVGKSAANIRQDTANSTGQIWENDYFAPRRPWRGSRDPREHPLPESFQYISSRWPLDWEARVEYELLATVSRPGGSVLFPIKDLGATYEVPVNALAHRDHISLLKSKQITPLSGTFLSRLNESMADSDTQTPPTEIPTGQFRRFSLLERTQSLIRPAAFVKTELKISVLTPKYVFPGCSLEISIEDVEPSSQPGASQARRLSLRLKALTISLLTTTAVRDNATTTLEQRAQRTDSETLFKNKKMDVDLPVLATDPDLSLTPMPTSSVPSFTTYNIARWYKLAVELKVAVEGGETVSMSHAGIDINVLPKPTAQAQEVSTVVPSYEEAVEDPSQRESDDFVDKKSDKGPPSLPVAREEDQLPAYEP